MGTIHVRTFLYHIFNKWAATLPFDVSTCRYSLCYGKDIGRFVGNPDTFYMFRNTYGQPGNQLGAETVPSAIVAIYELGFALVAPTMIACSLAGTV
jgi:ammonia channel protein AmtB